ncbi:hypothetical protein HanRHA438_Chr05g0234141 [Helianthus annuus]|uniref:Uncharacterized protein n=1 Tax=Helianthus annuus TaxID=4232 RepID=A0A9K3J2T6_HELAN|nr:hypothetical protein HanXRQr2_Chr05g0225131 [Helianthus annuus]KAJ0919829.1 hypothetical protein HanRHA438_Chr05g0234141 [Helianthus annuus]
MPTVYWSLTFFFNDVSNLRPCVVIMPFMERYATCGETRKREASWGFICIWLCIYVCIYVCQWGFMDNVVMHFARSGVWCGRVLWGAMEDSGGIYRPVWPGAIGRHGGFRWYIPPHYV